MKALLILCCLAAATMATPGFDVCRVQPQTIPLAVNWRVLQPWQWWGESSPAERAQAICVASAWAGTLTTFAFAPFYEKHKWARTVVTVAAIAGVGGIFGTYACGALRERGR